MAARKPLVLAPGPQELAPTDTLNLSPAQALAILQAAMPLLGTTQPTTTGLLWNNGGFICLS